MSKVLVAYFSVSGVTAGKAQELAAVENADLFEICPAQPYTKEDLDYTNPKSRSSVEMGDPDCRPALAGDACDVSQYDTVFVGFPIWWGREPSAVVEPGKRLGGEISEADLKLWTEGLGL